MKKNILYSILLALLIVTASSCKKDHDVVLPISLTINLKVDNSEIDFELPLKGASVSIQNKSNNETYSATANESGTVIFESIIPGTYNINASQTISAETYSNLSGVYTENEIVLNYSSSNNFLLEDKNMDITLVQASIVGDWVFKQIYYGGSNTSNGASFRDCFVEIYNNSNAIQYADSLYFVTLYGKNNNNTADYLLPNLQFDWNKSLNMSVTGDANTSYIYAKYFLKFPSDATGQKYPVQPGESIILATTALDHTKAYANNAGKEVKGGDPDLTIDLSKADFEAYLQDYRRQLDPSATPYATDIDNTNVPNMEVVFSTLTTDLIFDATGRDAYAIVKLPAGVDAASLPKYADPAQTEIMTKTVLYPQIPAKYVLDGVQIQNPVSTSVIPAKLPVSIDAGSTFIPKGQYNSQSLVRKTKRVVNGRRVLQDTNNSASDFGFLDLADPSKKATSFID